MYILLSSEADEPALQTVEAAFKSACIAEFAGGQLGSLSIADLRPANRSATRPVRYVSNPFILTTKTSSRSISQFSRVRVAEDWEKQFGAERARS